MGQFPMSDRSGQPGQFVIEEKYGTIHEAGEKWPTRTIRDRGKEWIIRIMYISHALINALNAHTYILT